jgi:sialic acid synthase SpsE
LPSEQIARDHARRSIVLKKNLQAGEALTPEALTCKRPGTGIAPLHWDEVIGRRTTHALEADHILQWEDLAARQEARQAE